MCFLAGSSVGHDHAVVGGHEGAGRIQPLRQAAGGVQDVDQLLVVGLRLGGRLEQQVGLRCQDGRRALRIDALELRVVVAAPFLLVAIAPLACASMACPPAATSSARRAPHSGFGQQARRYEVPLREVVPGDFVVLSAGVQQQLGRLAMTGAVRKFLAENPEKFDAREWLKPAREAAKQICKARYIEFGCEGQGAKIKGYTLEQMAAKYAAGSLQQVVN